MIPPFDKVRGVPYGILPPGIHWADLDEVASRFAWNPHRAWLHEGFVAAVKSLTGAGCTLMYLDGSFVTSKEHPNDYDACWEATLVNPQLIDPVLLDFTNGRERQKQKYRGELFVSTGLSGHSQTFLDFFQVEKLTGTRKGIVGVRFV
jgi:hypothetical protein